MQKVIVFRKKKNMSGTNWSFAWVKVQLWHLLLKFLMTLFLVTAPFQEIVNVLIQMEIPLQQIECHPLKSN